MGNIFENEDQFFRTLRVLRDQREKGADRAGIFGSRAAGSHRPDSDIDIFSEIEDSSISGIVQTHDGEIHLIETNPDNTGSGADLIRKTTRWLWKRKEE
jgi:predicted nucleotidyltransferase